MVSRKRIQDLADAMQASVNKIRGTNTPIEYIELALSKIDREDQIDLATASEITVLPLVQARLAAASEEFNARRRPSIGAEVRGMFRSLSVGSRRGKIAAVYSN